MHTKVAALELKVKDCKEQLSELQESNKRQAGMLAVYAQNESESQSRFERLNGENVRLRITVNDLVTNRTKLFKQLQFEIEEFSRDRHCLQSPHSQSSSPEMLASTRPPVHAAARDANGQSEDSSDSDSQDEAPEGRGQQQAEQTAKTSESRAADRALSAETLPMSPRVPHAESPSRTQVTDMPEPSTTNPVAFVPAPAEEAPQAVAAIQ